ncbi:MAG: SsrA-binding protein SmpB [Candidatus Schekmanbacteria bacterium]|nr:MAG: SsrA-binding protein SmpB [Candidatus Schekmanbacteria bacterium]
MAESNRKIVSQNKKAYFQYEILEKYEAGMSLLGSEVKALREGRANLRDSYARILDGEVYLLNCHISPYSHTGYESHDPLRKRKLLLKRQEINKLIGKVEEKGFSLIPTMIYFKNGIAKVELALAKGKKLHDKRRAIKEKEVRRELDREIKERKGR